MKEIDGSTTELLFSDTKYNTFVNEDMNEIKKSLLKIQQKFPESIIGGSLARNFAFNKDVKSHCDVDIFVKTNMSPRDFRLELLEIFDGIDKFCKINDREVTADWIKTQINDYECVKYGDREQTLVFRSDLEEEGFIHECSLDAYNMIDGVYSTFNIASNSTRLVEFESEYEGEELTTTQTYCLPYFQFVLVDTQENIGDWLFRTQATNSTQVFLNVGENGEIIINQSEANKKCFGERVIEIDASNRSTSKHMESILNWAEYNGFTVNK
ncbi:hypothetical protein NTE28_003574 [Vibrio harveyi]|nr:hypothetical protein [Vibrio harveyi]